MASSSPPHRSLIAASSPSCHVPPQRHRRRPAALLPIAAVRHPLCGLSSLPAGLDGELEPSMPFSSLPAGLDGELEPSMPFRQTSATFYDLPRPSMAGALYLRPLRLHGAGAGVPWRPAHQHTPSMATRTCTQDCYPHHMAFKIAIQITWVVASAIWTASVLPPALSCTHTAPSPPLSFTQVQALEPFPERAATAAGLMGAMRTGCVALVSMLAGQALKARPPPAP